MKTELLADIAVSLKMIAYQGSELPMSVFNKKHDKAKEKLLNGVTQEELEMMLFGKEER